MVKLNWGKLRSPEFMQSFEKYYGKPMDYFTGSRFALVSKEIIKQQKLLSETHEGILKKFGKADEKRKGSYNIPDDQQEAYGKEMEKLEAHEFSIKIAPFDAEKLASIAPLSPQDIHMLEPMLVPIDMEKLESTVGKTGSQELAAPTPPPASH